MSTETGQVSRKNAPARGRQQALWVTGLLAPALLLLIVVRVWPGATALWSSLSSDFSFGQTGRAFVGFDNFVRLLGDPFFQETMLRTLFFNIVLNPLQVLLALLLAWFLTRRIHLVGVWRALLVLPIAVPIVGSTIVWGAALQPEGPVNSIISSLGGEPQPFFASPQQAMASIMIVASWIGIGYWMLFLITALQAIPTEINEAATLDRAGPIRTFVQVTLPMVRRQVLFVLVACTVANFALFVPIQMLTNGGPESSTTMLMFSAYQSTYDFGSRSTGATEVIILLAFMLLFVLLQFRLLREKE